MMLFKLQFAGGFPLSLDIPAAPIYGIVLHHSPVPVPAPHAAARYSSRSPGQPMARRSDLPTARNRTWLQARCPLTTPVPVPVPVPVHARHGSRHRKPHGPRPSPLSRPPPLLPLHCCDSSLAVRTIRLGRIVRQTTSHRQGSASERPAAAKSLESWPPRSPEILSSIISSLISPPSFVFFSLALTFTLSSFLPPITSC